MSGKDQQPIRLIVGLGNPGAAYAETRHNAGFWLVERVAQRHGGVFKAEGRFHGDTCRLRVAGQELWLLKPSTYMNRSGQSVSSLAKYFKIPQEALLVVHDELDLAPGVVKLKQGGGHAGHNGLRDIISALGGRDFWRLRIGIDHPGNAREVVDYVLGRPSREEVEAIHGGIERVEALMARIVTGEVQQVMNQLHGSR
ncbi:MAG: aminoacyl-tRNA hydrolase [Candidatus Sedimenticola endophacoides]|uniref:Peptidyl-tRNA hydrolase n=1 Tax=Candidatus Sedimenticola endophacoides TaxID=2548426 RepID=A0A657Q3V0_9GAMM|nr:MAG: aminoacyl-tRNA hydrolase [Candidatus Sedimenticola endophacoides]OQX35921.1 MAG: aminoacyl-tRNA hydrolase [Candidatus Sedimenticola endophacoides]OQX40737.1 MAG: aminoacyl-tRNA hydrolase [Candidatus Sedimenticola endophacoides]OQX42216.1 MAG: aminoacyl-tRNA hydrolase [Candidatus Sedimenticola endophacoides]OQX42948.1 MAG: aminoacyl-tRNA hydrolase [Candidatus Sedimenticola endophacoides]